jgi:hypothetical protein
MNMNCIPSFIVHHNPRTRLERDSFVLPINNTRYQSYNTYFTNRICRLWNSLPLDIREIPLTDLGYNSAFKNSLKKWLFKYTLEHYITDDLCTWTIACICPKCRV